MPASETRTFQDRLGVQWRVYEVAVEESPERRERREEPRTKRPAPPRDRFTTRPLPRLRFESDRERRELPIPNRWWELPDDELEDLMGAARPV